MFPEVAKEWHPTKNKELTPKDFTYGSYKKVWWLCPKDHSYETAISERTGKRHYGCPYCSGRRVGDNNNLLILFPEVAKEWHPTKNKELTPNQFTYGSGKKVWWKCSKKHNWQATIVSRTKGKSCPLCGRQKRI